MRYVSYILIFVFLASGFLTGCNKTAKDTNRPPVVNSFSASFSGGCVKPDSVVQITVNFSDPDIPGAVNIADYEFKWTAVAVEPADIGYDPCDNFLINDDKTCYWRTPLVLGFYKLVVEIKDRYDAPVTGEYTIEVSDNENPLIINSFSQSFAGSTADPDTVINIKVNFTDPDVAGTPNPADYSFNWTAQFIDQGTPGFNPDDNFLINDDVTCFWRTPLLKGYYRLSVEISETNGDPITGGFTFQVTDNKSPIITNVEIEPDLPQKNEPVTITVTASDPDGNVPLTYTWSANKGYFTSKSDNVAQWVSSTTGDATITVKVMDSLDAYTEDLLIISVQQNSNPIIDGYESLNNRPATGETVTINVIAHDPDGDELSYQWEADGGSFSSINGADASWVAPSTAGNYTITVTVRDNKGGSDDIDIPIEVITPP
jgi:hypothetical protein